MNWMRVKISSLWTSQQSEFLSKRSADDKNSTKDEMEMTVYPNRNKQSTSTENYVEDFINVDNLTDFLNSDEVENMLQDSKNIFLLRLRIEDASSKPSLTELDELGRKWSTKLIVLFIANKSCENFSLIWKSNEIQHFLMTKVSENSKFYNNLKLFEFIAMFLVKSLKRGHLGIHSVVPIGSTSSMFQLHLLADHRNYNLLLVAAEDGNLFIVNFLLEVSCTTEYRGINAQTLAYENRHFDILLALLKANLTYPKSISIEECPNDIKEFASISLRLNEAMLLKNSEKVLHILAQNPQMRHFYNLNNESAPTYALKNKLWDIYGILISKNVIFGPHEKFSELKKQMKEKEREDLREIHYVESKFLPDNHMHVLISNSRIAPGTDQHDRKYDIIQNAFEILNQNPLIQIILMIVAASRNFRIVFDFNQDSVERIDPTTSDELARGAYYTFGRIYIAAKQLLDSKIKFEALGTLAHELCHCAMNLVYKNIANPYKFSDSATEQEFDVISGICRENCEKEEIIRLVYSCYSLQVQHAELIVRVPHLIMHYLNNPEKLRELQGVFIKLFEFFEFKVVPEMKQALPSIEAKAEVQEKENKTTIRKLTLVSFLVGLVAIIGIMAAIIIPLIVYTPTYKFSNLSDAKRNQVFKAPIKYKGVELEFCELFAKNSTAYDSLLSEHITQIFNKTVLNLSDQHLGYLEDQVSLKWDNMTQKLKDKFLNSNFTFQNESLKFQNLYEINSRVFTFLKSEQIIEVLSGKELVVHDMIQIETKFYVERRFWDENIREIYFKYMKYVEGDFLYSGRPEKEPIKNKTFENFYNDYNKQSIKAQIHQIKEIRDIKYVRERSLEDMKITSNTFNYTDTFKFHKWLQLNYNNVMTLANNTKFFILSSEAGNGKTVTFEQFTIRIKKEFPTRWVSYIDLKDYKHLYKGVKTLNDVKNILNIIFNLSSKNEFEKKIFEDFFDSGNLILLWNGFDEISPEFSDDVITFLGLIKNGTANIQFICTRPLYSDQLSISFSIKSYTLIPFDKEEQANFIIDFLVAENTSQEKILSSLQKVQNIAKSTKSTEPFDTPLMLGMFAELIANDVEIYESESLYEIYQKFVEKKVQIWQKKSEFGRRFVDSSFTNSKLRQFDIMKLYQSYALKFLFSTNNYVLMNTLKLKIMHQRVPKELTSDEISRMGILYINGPKAFKFTHKSFVEFFAAQFLVDNIYNADDDPSDIEADLRIFMIHCLVGKGGNDNFVSSFLNSKASVDLSPFNRQISKVLTTKYKKLLLNHPDKLLLIDFFKKDLKVLKILLQINETQTLYDKVLNFAGEQFIDPLIIKKSVQPYLTNDEFERFSSEKDKKGVILFTMYCYYSIKTNLTHESYQLDWNLMSSNDPFYVFNSIAKNLTANELKELSKSDVLFQDISSPDGKYHYIFNDNVWNLIENRLSKSDQKEILESALTTSDRLDIEIFSYYLLKVGSVMSDDEIYKIFNENNKFFYEEYFSYIWPFYVNHTTREQQREVLKKTKACRDEICYPYGIIFDSEIEFDELEKVYESYFNKTELQSIIMSHSSDAFPLVVLSKSKYELKNIIQFLMNTFENNKNALKEFLMRKIDPTDLNIFELLSDYNDQDESLEVLFLFLNSSKELANEYLHKNEQTYQRLSYFLN